jgi:hypothetical protein
VIEMTSCKLSISIQILTALIRLTFIQMHLQNFATPVVNVVVVVVEV